MFCVKCGKEIDDETAFCPFCGATIKKAPAPEDSGISVMCQTARVFIVLQSIFLAFLLFVGVCFLLASTMLGIIVIIATVIWGIYKWLSYKECYVSLNGTSITGHDGIIKSRKLVSPVNKVQDIGISNGLFGKIFHYHTIVISTAGSNGAEYKYPHMANAEELQAAFVKISNSIK
ncbi:MAG: PH domain-containing protein [Clostridiales bacterium]|nr:PH domain-containing protein [Clostridiales bacterium]